MTKARDLATSGPSGGLVLITPTSVVNASIESSGSVSFNGQGTVNINGVFSSLYDNYKIVLNNDSTSGTNAFTYLRLRANGLDSGTSVYNYRIGRINLSGTFSAGDGGTDTGWRINYYTANGGNSVIIDLFNPYKAQYSFANYTTYAFDGTTGYSTFSTLQHVSTTQYDGFSILTNTGTITGSLEIYGYKK